MDGNLRLVVLASSRNTDDEITGHDNRSVAGRSYGSVPIHILKEELDKITFDVRIPKWKSL